jgi:hypothetical protein
MKKIAYNFRILTFLFAAIVIATSGCQKETDDLELATNYPTTPEVFIDAFSSGLNFDAWGKVTAFDIDYSVKYKGTASMRIDVPDPTDPAGNYAGGVFYTLMPRDLSANNALTFWAKATKAATMNASFGSFAESPVNFNQEYKVAMDINLNSTWKHFIIPIPDPSKLNAAKGMFSYSAGTTPEDPNGYSIWIDEVKFENLGTIAHQEITISNTSSWPSGSGFIGQSYSSQVLYTVNLPSGVYQSVVVPSGYLSFSTSDSNVATVNEQGVVTVASTGSATITATCADLSASGDLTLTSVVPMAETPTEDAANVISLFSDSYAGVPIDLPRWDFVTNTVETLDISGNKLWSFSTFSYLPITFNIDASDMTHLHFDIYVVAPELTNQPLKIAINDAVGGEKALPAYAANLTTGSWTSIDIPLSSLGITEKSALTYLIIAADPQSPRMTDLYLDNVYFYHN